MAVPAPARSLPRGHGRCAIVPDRPCDWPVEGLRHKAWTGVSQIHSCTTGHETGPLELISHLHGEGVGVLVSAMGRRGSTWSLAVSRCPA
jgi:hypothetical protein